MRFHIVKQQVYKFLPFDPLHILMPLHFVEQQVYKFHQFDVLHILMPVHPLGQQVCIFLQFDFFTYCNALAFCCKASLQIYSL
uniref:Uncharacterized protein n=1 Tax=viral metagenome TaxID=1070528 RepID=A0A6C0J7N8_9ZZZZ